MGVYAYYYLDDISITELEYTIEGLSDHYQVCYSEPVLEIDLSIAGATNYKWSNGNSGSVGRYSVSEDVKEFVDIVFDECIYRHYFTIDYIESVEIGKDTVLCIGEELIASASHSTSNYKWSDGSLDSSIVIRYPGIYSLTIPHEDCQIEDSIEVFFIDCPGFIPNVITPNGDSCNDFFVMENIENRRWSLRIYNRWGAMVYQNENYNNNWNGATLESGVYYYYLFSEELNKSRKGWIEIIR